MSYKGSVYGNLISVGNKINVCVVPFLGSYSLEREREADDFMAPQKRGVWL